MAAIDLRSDTVTQPTSAMRKAMAEAAVGDDVFGEDPSVRALEERVASLVGMETALFMPSGTMANQIALQLHCRPGDAVFTGRDAHLGRYEAGAAGAFAGVERIEVGEGTFTASDLRDRLHDDAFYLPRPRLVCLENTHNHSGGRVFAPALVDSVVAVARERGLFLHLDGARLWNAAVALGADVATLARPFDTVSVCFSKGLGAPVGSALLMPVALRQHALRLRRRFGGALRQAGGLAAAALHALVHHRVDLAEDHRRARTLAEGLCALGLEVIAPETNIVVFDVPASAPEYVARARAGGVLLGAIGPRRVRAVLHRDLDGDAVQRALHAVGQV